MTQLATSGAGRVQKGKSGEQVCSGKTVQDLVKNRNQELRPPKCSPELTVAVSRNCVQPNKI